MKRPCRLSEMHSPKQDMARLTYILISLLLILSSTNAGSVVEDEQEQLLRFPPNFLLGAATAAYQIEGAWNASGKGESVWDRFVHQGGDRVLNNQTGDVAADSYHKFKEDVAILKELGFKIYRFSVSWPRILPKGLANEVNREGVAYYNQLIDELLANGITPFLTLYHWDHPQVLEEAGGWLNPEMVGWFADYARVVFREFGSKVKHFLTVNEPCYYCLNVYGYGVHAPAKTGLPGIGEYLCLQNLLKAHAKAYRVYQSEFKQAYNGSVGVNVQLMSYYAKDPEDTWLPELAFQFITGWMLNPIYSPESDYPEIMKKIVAEKSLAQGYPRSRLPELSPEWISIIRGSSDFLAINHYTSRLVEPAPPDQKASFLNDLAIIRGYDPSWRGSNSSWLKVVPKGFGDALRNVARRYGNPDVYIMENGVSDANEIEDVERIRYYQEYLKDLLVAIHRDHVNVKGYALWSLLDNFEWDRGYSERFGIIHVDFNDPAKRRTLKKSAHWWKRVLKNNRLDLSPPESFL